MSLAGASGVASPSNKMQSIGSNIAGPTTSNENNGAVAATSEPTQVRYLNIIDQALHFQIANLCTSTVRYLWMMFLFQVSAMPLPPMNYVKNYSDECMERDLAPPPPKPLKPNESYSMFGHEFTAEDSIIASLESQGIRRLYSTKDVDRKKELRKV